MVQQIQIDADQQTTLLSRCPGLRNIIQWLDSLDRRPGLSELESKLSSQEFEIDALRDCIGSTDDGYQRNVIKRTQHYEIVAICWKPGQLTPIHDHKGSDCAFLILEGVSTERIFESSINSERPYIPPQDITRRVRYALQKSQISIKSLMNRRPS